MGDADDRTRARGGRGLRSVGIGLLILATAVLGAGLLGTLWQMLVSAPSGTEGGLYPIVGATPIAVVAAGAGLLCMGLARHGRTRR